MSRPSLAHDALQDFLIAFATELDQICAHPAPGILPFIPDLEALRRQADRIAAEINEHEKAWQQTDFFNPE